MPEMETALAGTPGRLDTADKMVGTHEDTATETIRNEMGAGEKEQKELNVT